MGSLFQLRDYWYTSFPEEEFSPSALALADLDVSGLFDKIVLGSFQGILRVLNPSAEQGQMMPGDVLLEKQFDEPILQIECGDYLPYQARNPKSFIAVLFPHSLAFLEISSKTAERDTSGSPVGDEALPGGGEWQGGYGTSQDAGPSDPNSPPEKSTGETRSPSGGAIVASLQRAMGTFYTITVHSEIYLEHTAYNFASGGFGRIPYRMVCVQSMDGLLTIADHNSILYRSFLPPNQFLVPGPLIYCPETDTLLTSNSSMFLLSYSYSSIVSNTLGTGDSDHGTAASVTTSSEVAASRSSNLRPLWAFNLGEDAVDIAVCRLTRGLSKRESDIVVLCSTVLYILSESGASRMIRRLDVEAASLCVYPLPEIQFDNLLVGTFNGLVHVYSDTALEWSAQVPSGVASLHMKVATLCGVEGMIVNLSADNTLTINYLGTDPVGHRPQTLESKSVPYPEIQQEMRLCEQQIVSFQAGNDDGAVKEWKRQVQLTAPSSTTASAAADFKSKSTPLPAPSTAVVPAKTSSSPTRASTELTITAEVTAVDLRANTSLLVVTLAAPLGGVDSVTVVAQAVLPLAVSPMQHQIARITAGSTAQIAFTLTAAPDKDHIIPSSLSVAIVAVFRGRTRQYQTAQHTATAPLALVARPVPPVKNTAFSLQINTEKSPPPSLLDLFADMVPCGNVASNVLSLHYLNGADATVLVSKNAARFKLQGSTMEGLWLLASELTRRMRVCYAGDQKPLPFESPDGVPLADFLAVVDTHWAIRKEMAAAQVSLDQAAELFRAVEKRLLARFRDRTPADATAMTVLFQESYKVLQERADLVATAKRRLRQAAAMLSCCAQLAWFCLRMHAPVSMPEEGAATLESLFQCSISDSNDGGWEEVTEAVLVKLLDVKTKKVASTTLELAASTTNLKAYLTRLVETVCSGGRLTVK